jgi:hypothetical protein
MKRLFFVFEKSLVLLQKKFVKGLEYKDKVCNFAASNNSRRDMKVTGNVVAKFLQLVPILGASCEILCQGGGGLIPEHFRLWSLR